MLHLLPCLTTFNIVGYINGRKLNIWCGVSSICNSLHIELHLTCSVVCCTLLCHASLTGHASYLFVHHDMFMLVCLPCCLLLSGLLLSLASVSFRSCEDSFDSVCLSSSWTRSSSLRDLRQDDHTLEITSIFALLVARSIAMLRYLPLAFHASQIAMNL